MRPGDQRGSRRSTNTLTGRSTEAGQALRQAKTLRPCSWPKQIPKVFVRALTMHNGIIPKLLILFLIRRTQQLQFPTLNMTLLTTKEGIHSNQRQTPIVLLMLVIIDSSWILLRWYIVSIAPSTPPRSEIRSNCANLSSLECAGTSLRANRNTPLALAAPVLGELL